MTTIYFDPDEQHRFTSIEAESCPGLESLTGADFLVSDLPIDPIEDINWHIQNGSLFVQLKFNYDFVTNHEQRHKFPARVQALKIPHWQCVYLFVGDDREKEGYFTIGGKNPLNGISYRTFMKMKAKARLRGCHVEWIRSEAQLEEWIQVQAEALEESHKDTIFTKPSYVWDDGDIWQQVEEVSPESVQHILACGLPGFGPKRANSVVEYLARNHYPVCLYTALAVLCQIDEKGKRVHKIPSIGAEYWKRARDWVLRCQTVDGKEEDNNVVGSLNLCLHSTDNLNEFHRGAKSGIKQLVGFFEVELQAGKGGKVAFNTALQLSDKFIDDFYRARQLPEDEVPF